MTASHIKLGAFLIGSYVWVVTIFFGMVLLDIIYSRLAPEAASAFAEGSDFLLVIGFLAFLAALVSIALAWKSRAARFLLIASLVVMLFEYGIPIFFSLFIQNTQGSAIGPWLRILPTGAASVLAFIGMVQYLTSKKLA